MTKITIYICNPHDAQGARILQTYFARNLPGSTLWASCGLANPIFCSRSRPSPGDCSGLSSYAKAHVFQTASAPGSAPRIASDSSRYGRQRDGLL
jgi:hypothetical protein